MSPPYDRWRDVDGVPIADRCRVEQVAVAPQHGALPCWLHKHGEVIGRGTNRVNVVFDGQSKVVSVGPYLVRVFTAPAPIGDHVDGLDLQWIGVLAVFGIRFRPDPRPGRGRCPSCQRD